MDQMSRFAARQSYRVYEQSLNTESQQKLADHKPELDPEQAKVIERLETSGYGSFPSASYFPRGTGRSGRG